MYIMILFTNGCSWTYGGGLGLDYEENNQKRLASVWPWHLGQMLGVEKVINLAEGCGSNQRTVRTTYDWFLNDYKGGKVIAVIQWTEISRYEYYVTDKPFKDFSNKPEQWAKVKPGCKVMPNINVGHYCPEVDLAEDRLESYTDIEGMYRQIGYFAALADLFKTFNVEYYYWYFDFLLPVGSPKVYLNYVRSNYNFLIKDKVVCPWLYDRIPNDSHPSLKGHKQIAELIYDAMK